MTTAETRVSRALSIHRGVCRVCGRSWERKTNGHEKTCGRQTCRGQVASCQATARARNQCAWCGRSDYLHATSLESRIGRVCSTRCFRQVVEEL
jgi:hypothetical protein